MNEIAKKQRCLLLRQDIEIWIDEDKAEKIDIYLQNHKQGFAKIEGRTINLIEVVGLFYPEDLEDRKRRKLGQWKCKYGKWHGKNEYCNGHYKPKPLPVYRERTFEEQERVNKYLKNLKSKFSEILDKS